MERLRVNHHPEPLPEGINIVKCRSAPIMPERGRHTLRRILLAIGLAAASVLVPSVAALGSVASMPASPLKASPEAASDKVDSARLKAALAQLERFTTDLLRQTGVPGLAIAVVHDDRVVYLKGFGVREVGKPGSVDADTVFQLASLSKPLASTVVASVVGEGGLSWDEAVVKRLPQARIGEPAIAAKVTLRDLLSHRSGLPDHAGDHLEDIGFDRGTIFERLRFLPIGNRFRADYAYTNFGFTAAAEAAAVGKGLSWAELANQRLYRPLGMTRSSSSHADLLAFSNRAALHAATGDGWVARYQRNADAQAPAGGASASVRDLAQWLRLQLANGRVNGRQLVAASALAETHRPQSISKPPANPAVDHAGLYGLGWNISTTDQGAVQLGHSGAFNLGAATAVYLLPQQSLGIVVLSNSAPIGVPETIALTFLDLATLGQPRLDYFPLINPALKTILAQDYPAVVMPADPLPPRPASAYSGRYANAFFGPIAVVAEAGGLVLQLGPQPLNFALTPLSGDSFSYQPKGENAGGPSTVVFSPGADGRAVRVRIDNLHTNGQGLFERN
ncbi:MULTISPECIES: serine hydrolase [Synechococcaceae]|uniref:serine hydrolase n=2 Tax=Synechococcales TaxID=1890424 RepID=UPI000A40B196|nr:MULTISPECIES: serine hydrolase [Synechococcaceae]MCT4368794.1 serine hydrolase [Candidatus Regnicoccus frigidus MAG-AL2]TWB93295.1 CubicO group peptidase (beta-lactamase class C family) [Synechococcus sp. Ace-Pa]